MLDANYATFLCSVFIVTTALYILRIWMEELASRYGG
jgi:hypothetical protein